MSTTLHVHLTPRSARDEVLGLEGGVLRARVTAPPVEGRANEALLDFLARQLAVPRASLSIVAGAASRHKIVHVAGMSADVARQRLLSG